MVIASFEIVDLGLGPEGSFDHWGAGFNVPLNTSILGEGETAHLALKDALDRLALDGYDTRLLHEASIEAGFHGSMADRHVDEIPLHGDEEEEDGEDELLYHVGIRFRDESLDDTTEDPDEDPEP